ncbi:MAG: hypothetical protein JNK11_10485 [Alphaproteobacteria bacterium]|nr:hypothetical protein [Alphaproteobacteria bacterium]
MVACLMMYLFGARSGSQFLFGLIVEGIFVTFMALSSLLLGRMEPGVLFAAVAAIDIVSFLVVRRKLRADEERQPFTIDPADPRQLEEAQEYTRSIVADLDGIPPAPETPGSIAARKPGPVPVEELPMPDEQERREIQERMKRYLPSHLDR